MRFCDTVSRSVVCQRTVPSEAVMVADMPVELGMAINDALVRDAVWCARVCFVNMFLCVRAGGSPAASAPDMPTDGAAWRCLCSLR